MYYFTKRYQNVQGWMFTLEVLCEFPDLARLWQIQNVDINILQQGTHWAKSTAVEHVVIPNTSPHTHIRLTLLPDSFTMSSLADSAFSLFLHTMCTVPPIGRARTKHPPGLTQISENTEVPVIQIEYSNDTVFLCAQNYCIVCISIIV